MRQHRRRYSHLHKVPSVKRILTYSVVCIFSTWKPKIEKAGVHPLLAQTLGPPPVTSISNTGLVIHRTSNVLTHVNRNTLTRDLEYYHTFLGLSSNFHKNFVRIWVLIRLICVTRLPIIAPTNIAP